MCCIIYWRKHTFSSSAEEWTTTATPTTFAKITEGQLFFNSTTNTFKETITDIPAATWATGGNLNTGRGQCEWRWITNSSFNFWWRQVSGTTPRLQH